MKPESRSIADTDQGLRSCLASLLCVEELALGPSTLSLPAPELAPARVAPNPIASVYELAAGGAATPTMPIPIANVGTHHHPRNPRRRDEPDRCLPWHPDRKRRKGKRKR
jgi:hypothetical protein